MTLPRFTGTLVTMAHAIGMDQVRYPERLRECCQLEESATRSNGFRRRN
jgi:hypothetical protein